MKRTLSWLLAVMMILLLSACGGTGPDAGNDSGDPDDISYNYNDSGDPDDISYDSDDSGDHHDSGDDHDENTGHTDSGNGAVAVTLPKLDVFSDGSVDVFMDESNNLFSFIQYRGDLTSAHQILEEYVALLEDSGYVLQSGDGVNYVLIYGDGTGLTQFNYTDENGSTTPANLTISAHFQKYLGVFIDLKASPEIQFVDTEERTTYDKEAYTNSLIDKFNSIGDGDSSSEPSSSVTEPPTPAMEPTASSDTEKPSEAVQPSSSR